MQNTIVEKFSKIKHDYIISHDFLGKGILNIKGTFGEVRIATHKKLNI